MDVQAEISALRERMTRLERGASKRGRTNLVGAARYLGISDETLRQRIARGEGPRGTRNGRFWSFAYADLDAYAEQSAA
jgi:excisionase family DNA binding protein